MSRVHFVTHKGKQILEIDLSKCDEHGVITTIAEARQVIGRQPKASLLTLTNVAESMYNSKVRDALHEYAAANKPYVKAAALIGVSGLRKAMALALIAITGRRLMLFDTLEQARDWLAAQS